MRVHRMLPCLIVIVGALAVAAPAASAASSAPDVCTVSFKGEVTRSNVDPALSVDPGDKIRGKLTYDPTVVIGTVNPVPGGPFPVHALASLSFSVGLLDGTLDPAFGGFITPGLLDSTVVAVGAFFVTPDGIVVPGGNTLNMQGSGGSRTFVIGVFEDGIVGVATFKQPRCGGQLSTS
jgi:hypothetical protein